MGKKKKTVVVLSIIGVFALLMIIMVAIIIGFDKPDSGEDPIGLKNPDNITTTANPNENTIGENYTNRPYYSESYIDELKTITINHLSRGEYDELESLLVDSGSSHQLNPEADGEDPESYIARIRHDLALVSGIDESNGAELLSTFYSSEVLASAIAYLPMFAKYEAFINYDSCIVPAANKTDYVSIKESSKSDIALEEMLEFISDLRNDYYFDINAYDITMWDRVYTLYVIKDTSGFWQPYLLEQRSPEGGQNMSVLDAKQLMGSLSRTGKTLDDVIFY